MTKALIIRGHKYGFELLDNIIKQCGTIDMGQEAAQSFVVLLQQDELLLNKGSHATVSVSPFSFLFANRSTQIKAPSRFCTSKEYSILALQL